MAYPVGRHKLIVADYLEKTEELATRLYTKRQIAACLGISESAFFSKLKDSKELKQAYDRGWNKGLEKEAESIEKIKAALITNATTMALDKDGNPVGNQGGDTKAQMFYLRARAGWSDQKVEISGNPDKPILIAPLFAISYQPALDAFTKAVNEAND